MRVAASILFLIAAHPAYAGGVIVPEPSSFGLFALGVAGVIVGRWAAIRRERD